MVDLGFSEFAAVSRCDGERSVVRFDGELDCASEGLARAAVKTALEHAGTELVLDLRGLTFLDVRGVRVLLDARSTCQEHERRLVLAPAPQRVQHILELCGVAGNFELGQVGEPPAQLVA